MQNRVNPLNFFLKLAKLQLVTGLKQKMINQKKHSETHDSTKKARYIAAIVYLLIFSFIVIGSYINQQDSLKNDETGWHSR